MRQCPVSMALTVPPRRHERNQLLPQCEEGDESDRDEKDAAAELLKAPPASMERSEEHCAHDA